MIAVRCFRSLEEAAFLRDEVNALNRAAPRPDPFSTFEFFENFLRHDKRFPSGQSLRLCFLAAFDAGRLVGYLALKHVPHSVLGLRASKLEFLVTQNNDRPHLVTRPADALAVSEAIYAHLLAHRSEWSFLELCQQDAASALFPPSAAVNLKGYMVREWPGLDNATIHVRWDSLDAYFRSFSAKFRSNVSRQMRRLLAAGEVEYLASSDPAATPALIELYHGIEARSWKSRAGMTIGGIPRLAEYFRSLLDARQPMRISIQVLLLDGVPVAGLISGAFMKGLYALHMAYDDRVSRLAPGSALLLMAMRQAIEGRCDFLNLLAGFGYYKLRWQAQMTETRVAQIYRVGRLPFWHRVFGDWKRGLFPAGPGPAPVHFNPVRRASSACDAQPAESGCPTGLPVDCLEQARIAALVAAVRKGQGEFLSWTELAALMPFETKRVSG